MSKYKVAVTGLNGLIGRGIKLENYHDFELYDLFHRQQSAFDVPHIHVDLKNQSRTLMALEDLKPDAILHMAAMTHIDNCEKDRSNDRDGEVWKVNVDATKVLAEYSKRSGAHLLYLSTECVFDGKQDQYNEDADKKPINWYGYTKSLGEDEAAKADKSTILRGVIMFDPDDKGQSIFGKILAQLRNSEEMSAVSDQTTTPTYRQDIISAIFKILSGKHTGIFHVSAPLSYSPLEFAGQIADHYGFDRSLIHGKTLAEYFGNTRAKLRLANACLDCTRTINKLGISTHNLEQVLAIR